MNWQKPERTLMWSSIKWKEDFHQIIENFSTFKYHDLCYSYYNSKDKINRHLKRINEQSVNSPTAKCLSRSSVFDFKRNCFICGHYCEFTPDPQNPGCWEKNHGILCWIADSEKGNKSFKEVLLEVGYISYCIHILPLI